MIDRVENGFMDAAQENIAVHILGEDRNHGERSIRVNSGPSGSKFKVCNVRIADHYHAKRE
jgi:hypothetical protein